MMLWWLITLAVTAGALVYAFWSVDFPRLLLLLGRGDYWQVLPIQIALFGFYLFTGLRWQVILRPLGRYSLAQVTPAMMIGFAGNNLLPARLGEVIRAIVFARQFGQSRSGILTSLALERLLDVLAVLVFYLLAVALLDRFPPSIRLGADVIAWVLAGCGAAIFVFLRFPHRVLDWWWRCTRRLPERLAQRGGHMLENVAAGLAALQSFRLVVVMVLLSLVKWLFAGAMVWVSLRAYGLAIGPGVSMIVIAVIALAVTLPSTPGYVGAMQAAFVFALTPFGVAPETALAGSILFLVAQWLPVTAVGLLYGLHLGTRWGEVRAEAKREG